MYESYENFQINQKYTIKITSWSQQPFFNWYIFRTGSGSIERDKLGYQTNIIKIIPTFSNLTYLW